MMEQEPLASLEEGERKAIRRVKDPLMVKDEKDLDSVRRLILQRMREKKLSLADLSRVVGRNEAYMHQFTYRGSPKKLPEDTRRILAQVLELDEAALRGEDMAAAMVVAMPVASVWQARDIPVVAIGDPLSAAPTEWVARPPSLSAVVGAFAVWVTRPASRLRPGDLAYVHPAQPPRSGDAVAMIEADRITGLGELLVKPDGREVILVAGGEREMDRSTGRLCKVVHLVLS